MSLSRLEGVLQLLGIYLTEPGELCGGWACLLKVLSWLLRGICRGQVSSVLDNSRRLLPRESFWTRAVVLVFAWTPWRFWWWLRCRVQPRISSPIAVVLWWRAPLSFTLLHRYIRLIHHMLNWTNLPTILSLTLLLHSNKMASGSILRIFILKILFGLLVGTRRALLASLACVVTWLERHVGGPLWALPVLVGTRKQLLLILSLYFIYANKA